VGETPGYEPVDTRRFPSSWRLTFRYDEDGVVELADRVELPMIAPGSPGPMPSGGEYSGTWVELRDRQGRVLFDRVLHDPFRTMLEVHHPPGRRSQVVPGPRQPGEFEVLVPAMAEATTVVVWSSPLQAERRNEAAREVGRFELGGGPQGGSGG
jgi:hypothetical protein